MSKRTFSVLRWDEAMELLRSAKDLARNQLLNRANMTVVRRLLTEGEFEVANFDLRFFLEVVEEFCSDLDLLEKMLAGESQPVTELEQAVGGFARFAEAMEFLRSLKDPITKSLVCYSNRVMIDHVARARSPRVSEIDLMFFLSIMAEFCEDHDFLTRVLGGEDLRWFSDDVSH